MNIILLNKIAKTIPCLITNNKLVSVKKRSMQTYVYFFNKSPFSFLSGIKPLTLGFLNDYSVGTVTISLAKQQI